jgi:ribosomal protein S18 acetylase RimI-like enzyme
LSSYEQERDYDPDQWRHELARGSWLISANGDDRAHAILGASPGDDVGPTDRYLSYLWVAPRARRNGVATRLVTEMLAHLRSDGVARTWLWVLEGNEPARSFYGKLGFKTTGVRKPLGHDPSRYEELLTRRPADMPAWRGEAICRSYGN